MEIGKMKGSLNIQVTYDTTRSPSGDHRYDFVTKVSGDPILDQLSLAERQAFDLSIAGSVNEMLAGVHRILVPKEEWLFEDVAIVLFSFLEQGFYSTPLSPGPLDPDWKRHVLRRNSFAEIWSFTSPFVCSAIGETLADLLKFPDAEIKYISHRYLRLILDAYFKEHHAYSHNHFDNVDDLIDGIRDILNITPDTVYQKHSLDVIRVLLKETYSFTDDELVYILSKDPSHPVLPHDNFNRVDDKAVEFIARRARLDPNVFLSQVIATHKVLETRDHERDQQQ